jgi:hypothetical protein
MFCSATYRLFKLPKGDKSSPLQVIYSGDVTELKVASNQILVYL